LEVSYEGKGRMLLVIKLCAVKCFSFKCFIKGSSACPGALGPLLLWALGYLPTLSTLKILIIIDVYRIARNIDVEFNLTV